MGAIDALFVPIILVSTALVILLGASILTQMDSAVENAGFNSTTYINYTSTFHNYLKATSDTFPAVVVLLFIVIGVITFRLRTHPAFIPLLIIASLLIISFAFIARDLFFKTEEVIKDYVDVGKYSMLEVIMNNIVIITLLGIGVIIAVMFTAPPSNQF